MIRYRSPPSGTPFSSWNRYNDITACSLVAIVASANLAGRGWIELTRGLSPLRSQARKPPTSATESLSQASPNS